MISIHDYICPNMLVFSCYLLRTIIRQLQLAETYGLANSRPGVKLKAPLSNPQLFHWIQ